MAFIFSGDFHADKSPLRISACVNYLDYLNRYADEHNINTIVIGGDLYHTSNNIKAACFLPIFEKIYEIIKAGKRIIMIVGNHEIQDRAGTNLLTLYSGIATVIDEPTTIEIDGFNYDVMNYNEDPELLPRKSSVLLTHLAVRGFVFESNRVDTTANYDEDSFDGYNLVVSGHLHTSQTRDKFCFVGSPFPTRSSEGGKTSYFAVVDRDSYKLEIYDEGPDYLFINAEDIEKNGFDSYDFTNKMVTIRLSKKVENFVKLRDIMYNRGAISVDPEFIKEEQEVKTVRGVDASQGVVRSIGVYLKDVREDKIDNAHLLRCFKNVLERVKEQ